LDNAQRLDNQMAVADDLCRKQLREIGYLPIERHYQIFVDLADM
jgi:hypothetical protein